MEQYILDLIKENNRVIIPNFGAFIVAKEKGFTILFNNFLSFNDGLLVDHVMTKTNVDKEKATAQVEAYVDKLKETLDTKGLYSIKGLGTFTKDTNGILRFTQSENINTEAGDDVKEEEELLDIVGQDEEPEKPIKPEVKPEEKPVEEKPAAIISKPVTPPVPPKPEAPKEKVDPVKKQENVQKKTAVKEEKKTVKSQTTYQYDDNDKKNKSLIIFVVSIIFLIVVVAGVYFILIHGKNDESKKTVTKKELVKPVIKKQAASAESTKVAKPINQDQSGIVAGPAVKKTEDKPAQKPSVEKKIKTSKPHHLIVGSFKDAKNAERFVEKLKAEGFTDSKTLPKGNMTLVSIESFAKVRDAEAKQEEILNSKRMESWILTRK